MSDDEITLNLLIMKFCGFNCGGEEAYDYFMKTNTFERVKDCPHNYIGELR